MPEQHVPQPAEIRPNAFVHVHKPDGETAVFGPDDALPTWAIRILLAGNPSVLPPGTTAPRSEGQ